MSPRSPTNLRTRAGASARHLALAIALASCGRDVIVGVDRGPAAIADGGAGDAGIGELRAVRRLPAGGHVSAGWAGCTDPTAADCDRWLGTISGSLTEEARVAREGTDVARALTLIGEDRVVAGMQTADGVATAWAGRRSPTGPVWELTLASDPTRPSDARAVELAPDGTLVFAGNERLDAEETSWIARVRPDGSLAARVRVGGSQSSSTTTTETVSILPSSGGHIVYLGGQARVSDGAGTREVPIVLQYSADLALLNSKAGIGIDGVSRGSVKTLLTDRTREVTACAQVDDGVGVSRMFDYLSDVQATRVIREDGARIAFGGCTVTDDGALLLAGAVERADGPRPWAAVLDRVTLEPRRTRVFDVERGLLVAVAPSSGGAGLAVGTTGGRHYFLEIAP